jgi:hypothetical protein
MPRSAVVVCSWLALVATGCSSGFGGRTIAYEPGRSANTRTVPAGEYLLIRTGERPTDEQMVDRRTLGSCGTLGFAREADGTLVTVAGATRTPVAESRYRWQAAPTTDSLDGLFQATGRRYTSALEPVGGAIAFVTLAPFFLIFAALGGALPFGK